MQDMELRLATLERTCRRLKAVIGLAIVFGALGVMMAANRSADEIKARRLVIVDDAGKERGYFGIAPSTFGHPWLVIKHRDPGDGSAASISMDEKGENVGLAIFSKGMKASVQAAVRDKDRPIVEVEGPRMREPAILGDAPKGR